MPRPIIPVPDGFVIGDRIVTNKIYARITPRCPGPRYGIIVGGSRSNDGSLKVLLDDHKLPYAMSPKLFKVIPG